MLNIDLDFNAYIPLLFLFIGACQHFLRLHLFCSPDVSRLPGPSWNIASWVWGHELLVFQHDATHMYSTWASVFGPLFRIKAAIFHPDIIIATDHAAVRHVFADTDNYVKSPSFRPPIAALLGKGLVWAEGDDHKKQRRILASAFSQESIKAMSSDVIDCAEKLETRLVNHVLSNAQWTKSDSHGYRSGVGVNVNIVEWTSTCTLNIIGRVAFGHDFSNPPPSDPASATSAAETIQSSWSKHVRVGLSPMGFICPLLVRTFPWIAHIPGVMRSQGGIKAVVRRIAGRMAEEHKRVYGDCGELGGYGRRSHKSGVDEGRDILSIMMRARKNVDGKPGSGEGLSDEQILDNISTFTMVGHETTATVINFTLLSLAQHPAYQTRLREEILSHGRNLQYDDLNGGRMPWLDAVVKEGLRLHPASPQTERVALRDDVIPLSKPIRTSDGQTIGEVQIKSGQVIHIPFTVLNTNPVVWGADAETFNPTRWITDGGVPSASQLPHGWSGLSSFCDGPRNCIGWRLAVFEFKVILATLIRSLEFHDTRAVVHQKISPTLQPVTDGQGGVLPLYVSLV